MSSNYELQTGNDWVHKIVLLFIQTLTTGKEQPADEVERAKQEVFNDCKDNPEHNSPFGCFFKSQNEVEKFCNSKNDCIGYIKSINDNLIEFTPLRKEPVRLPAELKTGNISMGQSVYFKKKGTGSMNKNTNYIIIGVIVLLILLGLFMFLKKSNQQ